LRLDVAFLPSLVHTTERTVCVVIDLVRATTTICTLFERGCSAVFAARTVDDARAFARDRPALLCGERQGSKVPGFDYGNSPVEFHSLDLSGKDVVLSTTNGTVALHAVRDAPLVLTACLRNAQTVVHDVLKVSAVVPWDVTMVCAGAANALALDDAYCAGYLVTLIQRAMSSQDVDITDAARMAGRLYASYNSPLDAIQESFSGRSLADIGLGHDLPFVAELNTSTVAPRLVKPGLAARYPIHLAMPS